MKNQNLRRLVLKKRRPGDSITERAFRRHNAELIDRFRRNDGDAAVPPLHCGWFGSLAGPVEVGSDISTSYPFLTVNSVPFSAEEEERILQLARGYASFA